jgi:hypothetical protein
MNFFKAKFKILPASRWAFDTSNHLKAPGNRAKAVQPAFSSIRL